MEFACARNLRDKCLFCVEWAVKLMIRIDLVGLKPFYQYRFFIFLPRLAEWMFIFYGKQQNQQAKVKANNSTRSWGFFKGRIYDV